MDFLENVFEIELTDNRILVGKLNLIDHLGNISVNNPLIILPKNKISPINKFIKP